MKNVILFATVLLLCTTACQQNDLDHSVKKDKFQDKFYPQQLRDLQKAFPETSIDIVAYKRGKAEVQEDIKAQSLLKTGLDLPWTIQGPGNIGARINTIAQDESNKNIIYAGFAGGGLWRTMDGGANWLPIFDDEIYNSISEITLDPKSPGTVYVGTGDPNVPGRAYIGSGLYKSTDYGDSWTYLGLEKQKVISKIQIHPTDPNTLYVSSMGLPFEADDSRGLFKSTDGGENWEKIFYFSDSTGVSDILINPENPELMYAATWDRVRNNQVSITAGEGSGIYTSVDGGVSWNPAVGIPDTTLSRTGLAICEGSPNNVYAVTVGSDFEVGGVYRSSDYGATFNEIPTDSLFFEQFGEETSAYSGFGWYFGKLTVDPNDPDHIYLLGVDLWETYDAGGDWEMAAEPWYTYTVHADKHELLITDDQMLLATDGGLYAGTVGDINSWIDIENIPTTQFYRVGYNSFEPNLYYGGAQDNGTTAGNAALIDEWPRILGGDGFQPIFNPNDPDHWFAEIQFGSIRMTRDGGQSFRQVTRNFDTETNWDTPYFMSPHNSEVLYMGRKAVYMAPNSNNPRWEEISEDLTLAGLQGDLTQSISALDESPVAEGLLYAGTTNGKVFVRETTDWVDISEGLPERYVTSVKASPSYNGYVYVTLSGYKENEFQSRVFRSESYGNGWTDIGQSLPDLPANDIYILPGYNDRIMFVATDGGVYATLDYGDNWSRLGNNMPNVVCHDLEYNVAREELVVATFGRGIMSYPIQELMETVSTDNPADEILVSIYPNPAQDYFTIQLGDGLSVDAVSVIDVSGQLKIKENQVDRIDISQLAAGSYYAIIKANGSRKTVGFIKS